MKSLRKLLVIFTGVIILSLLFSATVFAGSIYPGASDVTLNVGESTTVTIGAENIMGTYSVWCEGNISVSGGGPIENDAGDGTDDPGYVTITGNSAGTGTVYVDYNVATYDTEEELIGTLQINVNVVEPANTAPQEQEYEEPVQEEPQQQETEQSNEAKSDPSGDKLLVTVNDMKYVIQSNLKDIKPLPGFTVEDGTYLSEKVQVLKHKSLNGDELVLYVLAPVAGKEDYVYFVFNEEKGQFKNPKSLKQGDNTYYFFSIPSEMALPDTLMVKEITIGNEAVKSIAPVDFKEGDIVYVYAMSNAEEGFYSYDTKEKTIQRAPDFDEKLISGMEAADSAEENRQSKKTLMIVLIIAIAAVIVMGVLLVVFKVKSTNNEKTDDY